MRVKRIGSHRPTSSSTFHCKWCLLLFLLVVFINIYFLLALDSITSGNDSLGPLLTPPSPNYSLLILYHQGIYILFYNYKFFFALLTHQF